jgi:hypothetical protein
LDLTSRKGITNSLRIFEVAMRVAGISFRRRSDNCGNIVLSFKVGFGCEVHKASVRL